MNTKIAVLGLFTASVFLTANSYAANINWNGVDSSSLFGSSYDNPKSTIISFLNANYDNSYTLNLLNGKGMSNQVESWYAKGATSIILEEIAGYADKNTFGWYNTTQPSDSGQIFSGPDGKGSSGTIDFTAAGTFGFYIDPNGNSNNRMFTEHLLNSHNDYQLTIFQINNSREYILGWEDLDLNGKAGGDRDYQDMIVRVNVAPVPEPATMFLLGTGLAGLAGLRLVRKKK